MTAKKKAPVNKVKPRKQPARAPRKASAAKPRTTPGGSTQRAGHVPSPHARARATALATKMPLAHYPASARFEDGWADWGGLKSGTALGKTAEPGLFGALRGNHVFVYGGPSCFYRGGCVGDAAMYFSPGAEAGRGGGATPFDSGSLEDTPPRLQPFRSQSASEEKRWRFFKRYEVPVAAWRASFETWLVDAYDDPDRYLETSPDRHGAGEPDRLKPKHLLLHNGTRGRRRYGPGECGDRRAWTWEVRIEAELPFDGLALLHVPFDSMQRALAAADRLRFRCGRLPRVKALPRGIPASAQTIYENSGDVLRELLV